MPAERDQQHAFGPPTGLWPGQDIPRQQGTPVLPWPEAAGPVPPIESRSALPWPETGAADEPGRSRPPAAPTSRRPRPRPPPRRLADPAGAGG